MPDWKIELRNLLSPLNLAPTREADILEELALHAEDRFHELVNRGVSENDARRAVLDELNDHELLTKELGPSASEPVALGAMNKARWWNGIGQDIGYGFRMLRKDPKLSVIAMVALALGIGANTVIFSVVNGVLLQPLGYPQPDRLVNIFETNQDFTHSSVAYLNYLDWRRQSRSFVDMGIHRSDDFNFTGSGEPERVAGEYVSASLFPVLGVRPLMGRWFAPDDDRKGSACTVMLSYAFWQRRFAADTGLLGKSLKLNASDCTVIGILPANFLFRQKDEVFVPVELWNSVDLRSRDSRPGLEVVARLKAGVTAAAAQAEMHSICNALARAYAKSNAGHSAGVRPMKDDLVQFVRPILLLLMGAVGLVLIIACANVANLLLARSAARAREFAIRTALGADRWRVVRQLLTESIMLSLGGALLGLLLARWGTDLVLRAAADTLPRAEEVAIDPYVLLFTLVIAIVTGLLFGLAPAFQGATINPQDSLKEGTRGAGGGRRRTEGLFVAAEIGLAVVLLAGAGLMMQSIWRLFQVNPGLNPHNVLTTQVALSPKVMTSPPGIRLAYQQMLARLGSAPGVQNVAITALVPLGESDSENDFWLNAGPQPPQDQLKSAVFYVVSPGYKDVMQIPLRSGRFFTDRDTVASSPAIVIDEVLAKHFFKNQDPIGREISIGGFGAVQIVGVVGHVKQWGLDSDDREKIRDQIYFSIWQVPDQFMFQGVAGLTLVVRTKSEPFPLLPAIRAQVAGPTKDQPIYATQTMEEIIAGSLAQRRFIMALLIVFAALALLLAAVGIYGVVSYAVTRRTHEIGVRSALGASRNEILNLVIRQGMKPAAVGLVVGLGAAAAMTRLIANQLYNVSPLDPPTLLAVTLLLGIIALVACYVPARRASAVDPVVALRDE